MLPSSSTTAEPSVVHAAAANAAASCRVGFTKVAACRKCAFSSGPSALAQFLRSLMLASSLPSLSKQNARAVPSGNPATSKARCNGCRPHVLQARLQHTDPNHFDMSVCKSQVLESAIFKTGFWLIGWQTGLTAGRSKAQASKLSAEHTRGSRGRAQREARMEDGMDHTCKGR
jgi:hypothetical protein